jgi:hypothetical protein
MFDRSITPKSPFCAAKSPLASVLLWISHGKIPTVVLADNPLVFWWIAVTLPQRYAQYNPLYIYNIICIYIYIDTTIILRFYTTIFCHHSSQPFPSNVPLSGGTCVFPPRGWSLESHVNSPYCWCVFWPCPTLEHQLQSMGIPGS